MDVLINLWAIVIFSCDASRDPVLNECDSLFEICHNKLVTFARLK